MIKPLSILVIDDEADIRDLRASHAGVRRVSVFVEIDDEPLYTVNGRHVISEVVELCGGSNVFADHPQLAPQVAIEAVLAEYRWPNALQCRIEEIAVVLNRVMFDEEA